MANTSRSPHGHEIRDGSGGGQAPNVSETISVGTQANIDFTDIDGMFSVYEIVLSGIQVDTDNADIYVRFSNDNGSTFRASTGDYQFYTAVNTQSGGDASQNGDGVAQIQANLDIGSGAGEYLTGFFYLVEAATAGVYTGLIYEGFNLESRMRTFDGRGHLASNAEANDAIRFTLDGGNFTGGTATIRGYTG